MGLLAAVSLGLLLVGNQAWATATPCSLYAEVGDAGDRFNPQKVTGGPYCGFSGLLGDNGATPRKVAFDDVDAFKFFFVGSVFDISVVFPAPGGGQEGELIWRLYAAGDLNSDLDLSLGSDFAAGDYVFEIRFRGEDPPYSAAIFNLVDPIAAPRAVPAPGVPALILAGLPGLVALRRRNIRGMTRLS